MYFKIAKNNEYHEGLNILDGEFDADMQNRHSNGGIYFTDINHVIGFLTFGTDLWEVNLPMDRNDFKIVADPGGHKWRSNMVYLANKRNLSDPTTFKFLADLGADIRYDDDYPIVWASMHGYIGVVKYLVQCGADVNAHLGMALKMSTFNGHLDVVKYLVENGADVHLDDDYVLKWSASRGHLHIVKYLHKIGVDINSNNNYALRTSARYGHLELVKYLAENGADMTAMNNYAIKISQKIGYNDIHEYLNDKLSKK